ncbi:hypothetical protein MKX03_021670 [Papaver bracteatum]|nr:hypothetical protein MKX03_021670 [Papaver bracteatum]
MELRLTAHEVLEKKPGRVKKGTRYGACLRKQIKKLKISQHSKYFCEFCGKYAVKRKAIGIWGCKDCGKVKAGGSYTLNTASAWLFTKSQGCGATGTRNNFCNGKIIGAQHFTAAAMLICLFSVNSKTKISSIVCFSSLCNCDVLCHHIIDTEASALLEKLEEMKASKVPSGEGGKDTLETTTSKIEVIFSPCDTEQDVQQKCRNCEVCMGKYFCTKCKFFYDDVSTNQNYFDGCGI